MTSKSNFFLVSLFSGQFSGEFFEIFKIVGIQILSECYLDKTAHTQENLVKAT